MDSPTAATADSALARAIAGGDQAAEATLYERFAPRVRYLARRELRSADLADDACSETFLRVVTALRDGRLRSPEALAAFVLQTTRHVVLEFYRRSKRLPEGADDQALDAVPVAADAAPDEDAIAAVRATIAGMAPRDRSFLRMFYVEELDKHAIAARLDIDPERVRLIKSRALQRFRDAYVKRGGRAT